MDNKALVVDDHIEMIEVASQIFAKFGYQVIAASNGEEALAVLQKDREIDIMFTDVVMPGISGIELAHRAQRLVPALKVVLTSGYLPNLQVPEDWSFIAKPYRMQELVKLLRMPK